MSRPDDSHIDFDLLWRLASDQRRLRKHSVHGPDHWRRVERNGLFLSSRTGADVIVVRLFAIFHDSRRLNEHTDPDHGKRGADYAASLRNEAFSLDDARFALLTEACIGHTDEQYHSNPTIGTCWDADRLDLGPVGIIPDPVFMSTEFGRAMAISGVLSFEE